MPTYREDLHLGHKVPTVETDDITDKAITGEKIKDRVIDWFHIVAKAILNEHIADKAVDTRTLDDGAVTAQKIANGAVTPEKLEGGVFGKLFEDLLKPLRAKDADLQNQIDSLQLHGMAVSNEFGDDTHIGVSQKTLTDAFNRLWTKIEDITGETLHGISMVVTPTYFIGEEGCDVHITADAVDTNGIFEHITFYINGEFVCEAENVDHLEHDASISDTSVVKCVAKILGIEHVAYRTINHYSSFWLGAGETYSDVMNVHNLIPITNGMRGAYDIDVQDGQRIFVILGESLREGFIRADIDSVEIQFTEETVVVDGNRYCVLTSENVFVEGTYNVDIEGTCAGSSMSSDMVPVPISKAIDMWNNYK